MNIYDVINICLCILINSRSFIEYPLLPDIYTIGLLFSSLNLIKYIDNKNINKIKL